MPLLQRHWETASNHAGLNGVCEVQRVWWNRTLGQSQANATCTATTKENLNMKIGERLWGILTAPIAIIIGLLWAKKLKDAQKGQKK